MKLELMNVDENRRIATIECKEEDVATAVRIFELFDKSIRDVKLENPRKGGR